MGNDEVMAEGVESLRGDSRDHIGADHVECFRGKLAGGPHRHKIRRPMYRYPPGFGAAIHHFRHPIKTATSLQHEAAKIRNKLREWFFFR
jgi:hypothetical protein